MGTSHWFERSIVKITASALPKRVGAEPDEVASHGLIQDEARPEARD
jgi:hypothetical protein